MGAIWNTIFYEPLYNVLIFLTGVIPDIGFAVITLTVLVKLLLYPLQSRAIKGQIALKEIQPEIDLIKQKFPNKEEQAKETFALYKDRKINPFSGCFLVLVQIPIIIALYQVFLKGFDHTGILYGFITAPESVNTVFLGILDLSKKSLVLAILAGVTQFFQARLSLSRTQTPTTNDQSFQGQFTKSMNMQIKYILPVFIGVVAYQVSGAVALYWTTSNLFGVFQEWKIRHSLRKNEK